jgi:hypothetical protein
MKPSILNCSTRYPPNPAVTGSDKKRIPEGKQRVKYFRKKGARPSLAEVLTGDGPICICSKNGKNNTPPAVAVTTDIKSTRLRLSEIREKGIVSGTFRF